MAVSSPLQIETPNIISSSKVATPFFYFHHIVHPDEATLEVEVIGPNLRYTFKHSRLLHLMSRSQRSIWLEDKTVGFLALVRGPDHHVSVWAESGHGSGRHGDVLDAPEGGSHAPEGVLPNTIWTRRVVQIGTMLGLKMSSPYDAMGRHGRTAGQVFRGFFHGSHAEAKLAVYGICSLLEGFGIVSDLDSIRPRHLRKLRKVSWADGARPALEIYISRKNCGRCGNLVNALSTITKIRIKLNFTNTLTKKVYGVSAVNTAKGQQRAVLPTTIARGVASQDDAVGTTEDNEANEDNRWDMMDLDDTDSIIEAEETVCDGLQDDVEVIIIDGGDDFDMTSADDADSWVDIEAVAEDGCENGTTTAVTIDDDDDLDMTFADDADSGIEMGVVPDDGGRYDAITISRDDSGTTPSDSTDSGVEIEGVVGESGQDDAVTTADDDDGDDSAITSLDGAELVVETEVVPEPIGREDAVTITDHDGDDVDGPSASCSDDTRSAIVVDEPDSGTDQVVDLRTPRPTINRALKFLKSMSAYINKVEPAKLSLRRPEWLMRSSMARVDPRQDQSQSAASTTSSPGTRVQMTPRILSLVPRRVRPRARRRAQNQARRQNNSPTLGRMRT